MAAESRLDERLKALRQALDKTQAEMAATAGIPLPTWKKYESGDREPGAAALSAMAATGVSLHWLLTGDGPMWHAAAPAMDLAQLMALLDAGEDEAPDGEVRYRPAVPKALSVAEAGADPAPIDADRLAALIQGVDQAEQMGGGKIDAAKKAALIASLYQRTQRT